MTHHDSGLAAEPIPRPPLIKRLRPADWVALDVVAAAAFAVVFVVGSTRPAYRIPIGVAYLVALVSTLPAAVRRLWPLPVLGAVLAGSVAAQAIGTGKDPSTVVAFVFYLVALRYPRRTVTAILAGVLALTAAATAAGGGAGDQPPRRLNERQAVPDRARRETGPDRGEAGASCTPVPDPIPTQRTSAGRGLPGNPPLARRRQPAPAGRRLEGDSRLRPLRAEPGVYTTRR